MVGASVQFEDSSFQILGPTTAKEDINTCDVLAEMTGNLLLYVEHSVLWWILTTNSARYTGAEPFTHKYSNFIGNSFLHPKLVE